MKHDDWRSQYIYALMNYQQLGFLRISDYVFLKELGRKLNINKQQNEEQWPVMKFKLPLQETEFLQGVKNICNFIDEHQLFKY